MDGNRLDEALLVLQKSLNAWRKKKKKVVILISWLKEESQEFEENRAGQEGLEEGRGEGANQLSHGTACNGHVDFQAIADDRGGDHLEAG